MRSMWSGAILGLFVVTSTTLGDLANYRLTFETIWSESTHPVDYPQDAHFSGVYGGVHNANFNFWSAGTPASLGIKNIAEVGLVQEARKEIQQGIDLGDVHREVQASAIGRLPGSSTGIFQTFATHPLVSVATMIVPSPDWFVGIDSVSLLDDDGRWIPELTVAVFPHDAGTDSGITFRSADAVTSPPMMIEQITGFPFENTGPVGKFTLTLRSLPGDFNGSGKFDAGDIDVLCFRLGESHPRLELTGNDTIEIDDVHALVQRVMQTRIGDTDLNGTVDFDDFLELADHYDGRGNWTSGDFDCNRTVDFTDFLALAEQFGFQRGKTEALQAVPEPTGSACLLVLTVMTMSTRRRRRVT